MRGLQVQQKVPRITAAHLALEIIFWCSVDICHLLKSATHHIQGNTFLHLK